jgi:hypothetical protein
MVTQRMKDVRAGSNTTKRRHAMHEKSMYEAMMENPLSVTNVAVTAALAAVGFGIGWLVNQKYGTPDAAAVARAATAAKAAAGNVTGVQGLGGCAQDAAFLAAERAGIQLTPVITSQPPNMNPGLLGGSGQVSEGTKGRLRGLAGPPAKPINRGYFLIRD